MGDKNITPDMMGLVISVHTGPLEEEISALKSENDRLTRQYEEAMTVIEFYADEDEHKSRNVDLDYGERARALITKHDAEKEGMKK